MTTLLGIENTGIQQTVPAASNFTGILPAKAAAFDRDRHVMVHPAEASDGGGLFLPSRVTPHGDKHAFCMFLQLMSEASFDFQVFVTSGFGDGTEGTTVDDPIHDAAVTSADSSDGVHLRLNVELLPGQGIRVITENGSEIIHAIAHFCLANGEGGRLIA